MSDVGKKNQKLFVSYNNQPFSEKYEYVIFRFYRLHVPKGMYEHRLSVWSWQVCSCIKGLSIYNKLVTINTVSILSYVALLVYMYGNGCPLFLVSEKNDVDLKIVANQSLYYISLPSIASFYMYYHVIKQVWRPWQQMSLHDRCRLLCRVHMATSTYSDCTLKEVMYYYAKWVCACRWRSSTSFFARP